MGKEEMILLSDLLDPSRHFLRDDTLTVEAHVRLTVGPKTPDLAEKITTAVLADYCALLAGQAHTDFTMVAEGGRKFPVHRSILAARSEHFAAVLKHKTKERDTGQCEMTDMPSDTLAAFLDFIYTGSLRQVRADTAEGLLIAADKYGFLDLEDACAECIASKISIGNAARLLILADQHSVTKLKGAIITFIKAGRLPAFVLAGGVREVQQYHEGWRLVEEIMSAITFG